MISLPCRGRQVVAYIVYTTNGLVAHIAKLAVRDDLRRQGIGKALVQVGLAGAGAGAAAGRAGASGTAPLGVVLECQV
jgi:predicted N-acetyltransferase YhbS